MMKRILLTLGLWLGFTTLAMAQVPCAGVGGVNTVPQVGVACAQEPAVASYAATGIGIVPASSVTDIACITGSATRVTRVQRVIVSGTAGTLVTVPVTVTKHIVANTGGTAATSTALPVPYRMDTGNPAATATTTAYTANPTITAGAGILAAAELSLNTTAALVGQGGIVFDWMARDYMQAPILRGVAQQVCVNLNATSPSSGLVNVTFQWTEAVQ